MYFRALRELFKSKMKIQLILLILNSLNYSYGYYIRQSRARRVTICQSDDIDTKTKSSLEEINDSYLQCVEGDSLKIIRANLTLSTKKECLNQYIGFNDGNVPFTCTSPHQLGISDVTLELKQL